MKSSSTAGSESATSASVWSSPSTSSNRVSSSIVLIATHARCDFVSLFCRLVSRPFQQLRSSSPQRRRRKSSRSLHAYFSSSMSRSCSPPAGEMSTAIACSAAEPSTPTPGLKSLPCQAPRCNARCVTVEDARLFTARAGHKKRRLCNAAARTVAHKCQRPENPQHNSFKLLRCGFLSNTTKWNRCVADVYPQHNANYADPQVPASRKPTTQQLKTVVLWVFWTLALVGHRTHACAGV